MDDLFAALPPQQAGGPSQDQQAFAPGAWHFPGRLFAMPDALDMLACAAQMKQIVAQAPWRIWETPGGRAMSVRSTNCGALGWVSDRAGYRYQANDPQTGQPWPPLPVGWAALARRHAAEAGYADFRPDTALINCYRPGTKMSLHQDRDETGFAPPIVSWSMGMSAIFLFGGLERSDPTQRLILSHGDVVVWGGPSRLVFHGISTLSGPPHPQWQDRRINITFRQAGG